MRFFLEPTWVPCGALHERVNENLLQYENGIGSILKQTIHLVQFVVGRMKDETWLVCIFAQQLFICQTGVCTWQGRVIALDKNKNKIEKLKGNIARLKLDWVEVFCYDGTRAVDDNAGKQCKFYCETQLCSPFHWIAKLNCLCSSGFKPGYYVAPFKFFFLMFSIKQKLWHNLAVRGQITWQ